MSSTLSARWSELSADLLQVEPNARSGLIRPGLLLTNPGRDDGTVSRVTELRPGHSFRQCQTNYYAGGVNRNLNGAFTAAPELPRRWDPLPAIWQGGRKIQSMLRSRNPLGLVKATLGTASGLLNSWREHPQTFSAARSDQLSVTYLLDRLLIAGGTLSVIQLVNELILRGVDARIACRFEDPLVYSWQPFLTRPMVFRNNAELLSYLPATDLVVATFWTTAKPAAELINSGKALAGGYFLQDFEADFYSQAKRKHQVMATYKRLKHKIVKSDWLAAKLAEQGYDSHKISIGLNLDQFCPDTINHEQLTERPADGTKPSVLAMARPGSVHRGFERLCQVLSALHQQRPEVSIRLFGSSDLQASELDFPFQDLGIISDSAALAQIYRDSTIFVDASDFQGLGRCGLEAMACGCACVLTNCGGVNEYASAANAVLVPPESGALTEGLLELLDNPSRRQSLVAAGLATAQTYSLESEAANTHQYLASLLP